MNFFTIFILFILLSWLVPVIGFLSNKETSWWKAAIKFTGSAFIVVGVVGFLAPFLSVTGGLNWLSESFEWPIGASDNAVRLEGGNYVVPHIPSDRIQIYDENLVFVRGWFIDAGDGVFKLAPSEGSSFFVYTARGHRHEFDILGNQISSTTYPGILDDAPSSNVNVDLDYAPYLWPFTHPFAAWLCAAVGLALVSLYNRTMKIT